MNPNEWYLHTLNTYGNPAGPRSRHDFTRKGYNPPEPPKLKRGLAPHLAGKKRPT